jgi:2-oxoisovalerate dehydrogenase E1 component alpha subunit
MTVSGYLPITSELSIVDTSAAFAKWPVFRVLGPDGEVLEGAPELPSLDEATATKWMESLAQIQVLDDVFYNVQRQGRISFYMQSSGEEAIHIGSASALKLQDVILAQYREVGVLLWRGFSLQQAADQCFSNASDLGKGRQMPVHYGSSALNFQTISSPLATQLPQAAGVAYALKLSQEDAVAVCYFGYEMIGLVSFNLGCSSLYGYWVLLICPFD